MRNKTIWYSILLVGLALLLVSSIIGCGQYTKEDEDEVEVTQQLDGEDEENGELPAGVIWWYEAKDHIGDRLTVCGPVVDSKWAIGSSGRPTFLNIGEPYPDPDRFTVVIWIECRANFLQDPEVYYLGKFICVTGLITEYEEVAEIEVCYPSEIQEQ